MDKRIEHLRDLDAIDGTVYGKQNKVNMVNPFKSFFIVHYPDKTIYKGNNLFDTGWSNIRQGVDLLQYSLSTGHLITIPKSKGYLSTIEVSESVEGFKLFHAIHVHCITDSRIIKYKIILKEDKISKYKIGDIIISELTKGIESPQWKMSS